MSSEKRHIRQAMERLLEKACLRESQCPSILESLRTMPCWKESDLVLGYLSFRNEFPLDFILRGALEEGKTVGVPRVEGKNLRFYQLTNLNQSLLLNRWGIREPDPEKSDPVLLPEHAAALIFVPGTAFDSKRKRLGKGGGFYDHFFQQVVGRPLLKLGIGFACQGIDEVPSEAHDVPMDEILLF